MVRLGAENEIEVVRAALFVPEEQSEIAVLACQMIGRLEDQSYAPALMDKAVRRGRWKLHIARSGRFLRGWDIPGELYDLAADPGETTNLARQRSDIVAELLQAISHHPLRSFAEGRQ